MDVVFGTAEEDSVDKSFKVIRPSGSELSLQLHEGREKSWHKSPSWSPKGAIRRVVDRVVVIFRESMPLAPGHQLPMGESHSNMIREAKTRTCQASKYLEREPEIGRAHV